MSIEIVIDTREHELHNRIEYAIPEQLDIGDILFRNENNENILLIERKTVRDLAASIKDGRLREQKARIIGSGFDINRIIYLIEGKLENDIDNMPLNTLIGSLINTQLRDGIKVYKTSNINETVIFLERLYDKLNKDIKDFWKYSENKTISSSEYSACLKTSKKSNMTPNVWFITQLSLIPQITPKIAEEIIKLYPSVNSLINEYDSLENDDEKENLLSDITYHLSTGKTRRIGNKISSKIYKYLYNIEENY
jgi:crossover junction endonuclease MUS81